MTYHTQRLFASAIGILLLDLVFLVIHYRTLPVKQTKAPTSLNPITSDPHAVLETASDIASNDATQPEQLPDAAAEMLSGSVASEATQPAVSASETFRATLPGFVFSGVLLGLLPMWNSAVFIAAAAGLGLLFLLFPLWMQMLALAITAGVIALPQMLYLSTGSGRAQMPKLLHWGYTLDHPTAWNVTKYLGFSFGFKWLLIALALLFANSLQRRVFVVVSSLLLMAFSFQFTIEVLANQKFFHIWIIIINLFVAFALWRLWRLSLAGTTLPGKLAAILLFILI